MAVSREDEVRLSHTPGRKPVDLVADMPRPQGRDVMWAAIRKLRTFALLDLEAATRINDKTIMSYLQGLAHAGYLSVEKTTKAGRRSRAKYSLVRDVGVEAPRVTRKGQVVTQGRGREQMWTAIRGMGEFNYRELMAVASTPGHTVASEEARDYVKHLAQARYLKLTRPATYGSLARYQLVPVRNTGPRAPQIQRVQQIFDPNENRVVWPFKERT